MRWFVLVLILFLSACAAPLPTPNPTPIPFATPTFAPHAIPPPPFNARIMPDFAASFRQVAGRAPFTVTFSAALTFRAVDDDVTKYEWDFDSDGTIDQTASMPTHVFSNPGVYTTTLRVQNRSGYQVTRTRRIVAFDSPKLPAWQHGVTAHLERRRPPYYPTLDDVERAAELMQDAGVQAVRMDFNWDMLNPTRKEWKFEDYDAVVRILRRHNLEILGILDYVSWWASSAQDSNDWRVRLYSEPLKDYHFARFTYETVSHFKNDVHVWQIWNEPNTEGFWKPQPNPTRYTSLLQEAYLAAKYADPDAVVLFAGMSGNGVQGNDDSGLMSNFVEQAYAAGARGYMDAMAIHPYMLPNGGIDTLREKIAATRAVMNRYGDESVPIWITEIGVPTDVPWWSTAPVQSEQDAANWLHAVYTKLGDLTPTIFWYQLQDRASGQDPEGHFGLLRADFSSKAAFHVLRSLIQAR